LYINDGQTLFMSDATSLTPIYINSDLNTISNNKDELIKVEIFNSNLILNLKSGMTSRITHDVKNESEENGILELLRYQHKYFLDKNIALNYKNNNFMKALISIMKPTLYNNALLDTDNSVGEKSSKIAKLIAKDFSMSYLTNELDPLPKNITYIRNQLFDISSIKNKSKGESEYQVMLDSLFYKLDDEEQTTELSLLTRKRNQNKELTKTGLLLDRKNVVKGNRIDHGSHDRVEEEKDK